MRTRWETLMRPDTADHPSVSTSEAVGVWALGVLWALACLWLGYLGSHWVLPGVLIAGLLALWGWRHMEWLWWFPSVLVVATMLEPLSPLPMRSRFGPLVYIDLLTIGVTMVAFVRAASMSRPLLPRTPLDGLILAMLGLFAVTMFSAAERDHALMDLKRFVVAIIVFYAATTVGSRPRGSRWIWVAFPLASGLIGLHAVWALLHGPELLAANARAADQIWGSRHGVFNLLLVALPVSVGLALSAGQASAQRMWWVSSTLGAVGLVAHGRVTDAPWMSEGGAAHWGPIEIARVAMVWITLGTLVRMSWLVRAGRRLESPRWIAVALTFVSFAVIEPLGSGLSGPAVPLLVVAAGLVVGTLRADRRAALRIARRAQARGPVLEEAA